MMKVFLVWSLDATWPINSMSSSPWLPSLEFGGGSCTRLFVGVMERSLCGIEFTHLLIGARLGPEGDRRSRLVLDRHSRIYKRNHEAAVGPRRDTPARQKCGLCLQMLELNVLGLAEHGNRLAAGIAGLKSSTGHLNFKRQHSHPHRGTVMDL